MSKSKQAKEIRYHLSLLDDQETICESNLKVIASRKMQLKRELEELGFPQRSPRKGRNGGLSSEQIIKAKASLLK
jgi:hypothetical protein